MLCRLAKLRRKTDDTSHYYIIMAEVSNRIVILFEVGIKANHSDRVFLTQPTYEKLASLARKLKNHFFPTRAPSFFAFLKLFQRKVGVLLVCLVLLFIADPQKNFPAAIN